MHTGPRAEHPAANLAEAKTSERNHHLRPTRRV